MSRRAIGVFVPTADECDMRCKARHERSTFDLHLDRIAKEQPMTNETAARERVRLLNLADAYRVPEHLRAGVVDFIVEGLSNGAFVTACMANDALTAVHRADPESLEGLGHLLRFIAHQVPNDARGSYERVQKYAQEQRARRRLANGSAS